MSDYVVVSTILALLLVYVILKYLDVQSKWMALSLNISVNDVSHTREFRSLIEALSTSIGSRLSRERYIEVLFSTVLLTLEGKHREIAFTNYVYNLKVKIDDSNWVHMLVLKEVKKLATLKYASNIDVELTADKLIDDTIIIIHLIRDKLFPSNVRSK